jgi:hypothetical protein
VPNLRKYYNNFELNPFNVRVFIVDFCMKKKSERNGFKIAQNFKSFNAKSFDL